MSNYQKFIVTATRTTMFSMNKKGRFETYILYQMQLYFPEIEIKITEKDFGNLIAQLGLEYDRTEMLSKDYKVEYFS